MKTSAPVDEVTVLCTRHGRRCMLAAQEGYPVRLMHMSRIDTPSDFCDSAQFKVRREYLADRDTVHAELESRDETLTAEALKDG